MTSTTTALRPSLLMATVLLALATATHAAAPTPAQLPRPAAAKPAPKPASTQFSAGQDARIDTQRSRQPPSKPQGANVAVGDVNGDGAPGATSRTTPPGGPQTSNYSFGANPTGTWVKDNPNAKSAAPNAPQNLGDTATHEVGHKGIVSPRDPASGQATGITSPRDPASGLPTGKTGP